MLYDQRVRITETYEHPETGCTMDYVGVIGYVRDVQLGWLVVQPCAWSDGMLIEVPASCVVRAPLGVVTQAA